jgi:nitrogen fixation/metabolism regulation signal transduction histidine kinase
MRQQRKIINFLIRYHLQARITLKFAILAFIFALIGELLVYLVELPMMETLSGGSNIHMPMFLFWYNIPLLLVVILAGIVITHRIAGPVYKIERKLEQVLQGDENTQIRLRQGDELQELADKINVLITRYQELRKTAKQAKQ